MWSSAAHGCGYNVLTRFHMWSHVVTYIDMEGPDDIVPIDSLSRQEDSEGSIVHSVHLRPVLHALDLACLFEVGDHYDGGHTQLPHHAPKVYHCRLHGAWGRGRVVRGEEGEGGERRGGGGGVRNRRE